MANFTAELTELTGRRIVVDLAGDLDAFAVSALRPVLDRASSCQELRFGLRELTFIDSTGIGCLIGAIRRTCKGGGEAFLCEPQPSVRKVLELTGVSRVASVVAR